jgi:sigma-B regulation protein RsbU (phosphoserine phosphatase)
VGIHAEIFNSVLNRRFITRAPREANLGILAILALLISIATMKTKPTKGLFILIAAIFLFSILSVFVFNIYAVWIDLLYPAVLMSLIYIFLTLFKYIKEWRKRLVLENELDIARNIQESFLPKKVPSLEGVELAAHMATARQVGGDLYDLLELGPGRLGIMIGDVSGKGIPASLFMAMVSREFKFLATPQARPEEVLFALNNRLARESTSNLFVTVFYLIFDTAAGTVDYSNGGHMPVMYLGRSAKKAAFLDVSEGAPLGLMEGPYSGGRLDFGEDDILVLYTDGVTEAMNSRGEMYGRERLSAVVEMHREMTAAGLLKMIEKDVRRFEPRSSQHDDITLIVIKIS